MALSLVQIRRIAGYVYDTVSWCYPTARLHQYGCLGRGSIRGVAQPKELLCNTMERSRKGVYSEVQEVRQCLLYQLPGTVGRLILGGTVVYRVEKSIWEGSPYPDDYRQHVGRSMDGHSQHETFRRIISLMKATSHVFTSAEHIPG
jgi:hypothetical protein